MIEASEKNFKEYIRDNRLVLVDFYATWCGPCLMQSEVLERISMSRGVEYKIIKVNVDNAPKIVTEYKIQSIPTLILFKDNKMVRKNVGYMTEEHLEKMIEEYTD